MLQFVDSHTHLADPAFDADREEVIERARAAGARALVCIGESLPAADRAHALALAHPAFIAWTAGVHPHDAAEFDAARDVPALRERMQGGAVAVGECGLDYHYDNSPRDRQITAFAAQLELAREMACPVVVHTRDAEADTHALVREAGVSGVQGVLHCFTGSVALARAALDAGWLISFSGIITFKKWTDLDLLRLVPDDRLLVESDAPYLAPVPFRGKRNEPEWVPNTVRRLAEARGADAESLGMQTAANAGSLFGLGHPRSSGAGEDVVQAHKL
ncbi:MAG TPA: TatD family hydrolase [Gemmatimonadaceae bacterium]|nr:TatD family hydrolase [Gemmatimonadaceae bacterium]